MELVVNHSHGFYESPKQEVLTPFVAFLGRTDNQEKRKIGEIADSVVNPSRRFYESLRKFGMKGINTGIDCLKSKETEKLEEIPIQA